MNNKLLAFLVVAIFASFENGICSGRQIKARILDFGTSLKSNVDGGFDYQPNNNALCCYNDRILSEQYRTDKTIYIYNKNTTPINFIAHKSVSIIGDRDAQTKNLPRLYLHGRIQAQFLETLTLKNATISLITGVKLFGNERKDLKKAVEEARETGKSVETGILVNHLKPILTVSKLELKGRVFLEIPSMIKIFVQNGVIDISELECIKLYPTVFNGCFVTFVGDKNQNATLRYYNQIDGGKQNITDIYDEGDLAGDIRRSAIRNRIIQLFFCEDFGFKIRFENVKLCNYTFNSKSLISGEDLYVIKKSGVKVETISVIDANKDTVKKRLEQNGK